MQPLLAFDPSACRDFRISAALQVSDNHLRLSYHVDGPIDQLVIPTLAEAPQFRDELWKTTCFEVFLQKAGQQSYEEWNFSPSHDWAHYSFESYRVPLSPRPKDKRPRPMELCKEENRLELKVEIPLEAAAAVATSSLWTYGLTAVLHTKKNERHYWALTHAGPKPDFHDARSFLGRCELRSS